MGIILLMNASWIYRNIPYNQIEKPQPQDQPQKFQSQTSKLSQIANSINNTIQNPHVAPIIYTDLCFYNKNQHQIIVYGITSTTKMTTNKPFNNFMLSATIVNALHSYLPNHIEIAGAVINDVSSHDKIIIKSLLNNSSVILLPEHCQVAQDITIINPTKNNGYITIIAPKLYNNTMSWYIITEQYIAFYSKKGYLIILIQDMRPGYYQVYKSKIPFYPAFPQIVDVNTLKKENLIEKKLSSIRIKLTQDENNYYIQSPIILYFYIYD